MYNNQRYTPWGEAQTQKKIADGIVSVSTASHGGYWISSERWKQITSMFPQFNSFTGQNWLEEDCDWAIAPLTWPELFDSREVYHALLSVSHRKDIAQDQISQEARDKAQEYAQSVKGCWALSGLGSGPKIGTYNVFLTRDNERKTVVFAQYPNKDHYSDSDVITMSTAV